jgi:hypothetical protein
MGQRPGHRQAKPRDLSADAGPTTCLRCDTVFMSWDRRQHRICQPCHEAMEREPSDEPTDRLTKPKGGFRKVDEGEPCRRSSLR